MKHLLFSTSFSFYLSLISNRRGRCGHISLSRCKPKEREREKRLGISFRTRGCCSMLLDALVKKLELAFSELQEKEKESQVRNLSCVKIIFICMRIKIIFISIASHLASI